MAILIFLQVVEHLAREWPASDGTWISRKVLLTSGPVACQESMPLPLLKRRQRFYQKWSCFHLTWDPIRSGITLPTNRSSLRRIRSWFGPFSFGDRCASSFCWEGNHPFPLWGCHFLILCGKPEGKATSILGRTLKKEAHPFLSEDQLVPILRRVLQEAEALPQIVEEPPPPKSWKRGILGGSRQVA